MCTEPVTGLNQGNLDRVHIGSFECVEQGGEEFLDQRGVLVFQLACEDVDRFLLAVGQSADHHVLDHPGIWIVSPEVRGIGAVEGGGW